MNPARLQSFLDAYVVALAQAITAHPKQYALKPEDTPESYAIRVACTLSDLIQTHGAVVLDFERSEAVRNACVALGLRCDEEKLHDYLGGI